MTLHQTGYKVLGWLCVLLFGALTVLSSRTGMHRPAFIFLFFAALGVYLILESGSLQMNAQSITYRLPVATYFMRWDEVQLIEIEGQGGNMVLFGADKRLAMNGPMAWTGRDKLEISRLLADQVETRGIKVLVTGKAMFRRSKDTKVRN